MMKHMALAAAVAGAVIGAAQAGGLRPAAMERLAPGAVRPQGWLAKQMKMQRDGLTGHAEELYDDIGKSDWITRGKRGGQFAWERGPYYAKGLLSLAFALDDAELKARAKKWVDAYIASQRENGDFGPVDRSWWAKMIALWTLRDWCEATGDPRVVPFLERYFAFQRAAFEKGDSLSKDSCWAIARGGDEIDVLVWLCRKTGRQEWAELARRVAGMSADWTSFYHRGGASDPGYRVHIVNYMQGLKLPALKWLLGGGEEDRTAVRAALDPSGWAMKKCGRPDCAVNGTEPLTSRSSTEGTELCATAEHILSAQVALEALGDAQLADDLEMAAYNTLPATLGGDGRGLRYYCLLNQPACIDAELKFACNGHGMLSTVAGPYAGYGCCRSNFHFAWPKVAESMWMKRDGGLAAVVYGDCTVKTPLATVRETGGYPFSDEVRFEILETRGGEWPLFLRVPGWSDGMCVKVQNKANDVEVSKAKNGFYRLDGRWKKGDVVEVSFRAKVEVTRWENDSLAVTRGPLLYALRIDAKETQRTAADWPILKRDAAGVVRDVELGMPMRLMEPTAPWNYALVADAAGKPSFTCVGEGLDRRLRVNAVRTSSGGWGLMRRDASGRAVDPPRSPVLPLELEGDAAEIELVPIALAQLRISLFPWTVGM
ncbi:MAG: glycoside hydrolase family 127 protein [Kiritimatiellae bacterium]|nr:glycoside hydrolase family 127 protein [Kiritimatiellia bacterium]